MDLVRKVSELQARADRARAEGKRIALVPTMGALHAGHLALVREAHRHADLVWVSIFVNPMQFGPNEDLDAYPRTFEADCAACEAEGVDAVFFPEASELYPEGSQTWVDVTELAKPLCGASRPTHFRGVTTVVPKLFLAAKPHVAVFGQKDFQQLAIIRRMAKDLLFDIDIVGLPTVREPDGLALSSRNKYLDAKRRPQALVLSRALAAAESAVQAGERSVRALNALVANELDKAPDANVDYAELRDPESLELLSDELSGPALLALAVFFPAPGPGRVRLIDNIVLPASAARSN